MSPKHEPLLFADRNIRSGMCDGCQLDLPKGIVMVQQSKLKFRLCRRCVEAAGVMLANGPEEER